MQEAELQYVDFTHKYKINQGVLVGWSPSLGWSPYIYKLFLLYVNLALKNSGSQISLADKNLVYRLTLMEDDLSWKITYDGRQPFVEDDL